MESPYNYEIASIKEEVSSDEEVVEVIETSRDKGRSAASLQGTSHDDNSYPRKRQWDDDSEDYTKSRSTKRRYVLDV